MGALPVAATVLLCILGAFSPAAQATDCEPGFVAGLCPPGHYCPPGSPFPEPCPAGTFTPEAGSQNVTDCLPCSPGFVCPSNGTVLPTVPCPETFYCPGGQAVATQLCPAGNECPEGSFTPTPCLPGFYAPDGGAADCDMCASGFFCDAAETVTPTACPKGHRCPTGTSSGTSFPCPSGTLQPDEGQDSCEPCPEAYYCPAFATVDPIECPAGFFCPQSSTSGTANPCPAGTFSNFTGMVDDTLCAPCPPGVFCEVGSAEPTGPCLASVYCPGGAETPTGGILCPAGHYCPQQSSAPIGCPRGTFSNATGNTEEEDCTLCTAGSFCSDAGLAEPSGLCYEGFLCTGGATVPTPLCNNSGACTGSVCPVYGYCPPGSGTPTPCPNGTYSNVPGLQNADQCAACPAGKYCVSGDVAGDCAAGYLCHHGNGVPNPENEAMLENPTGEPCPRGFYCPSGSHVAIPCTNGTFSSITHATSADACGPCPAGSTCIDGVPATFDCKQGHYCPGSGMEIPCPLTTYNPLFRSEFATDCLPCPAGTLCDETGIAFADHHLCPVGMFCGVQATFASDCPAGTFRDTPGANSSAACDVCPAGSACRLATVTPEPCEGGTFCRAGSTNATVCPPGSYCPPATQGPIQCPAGSYCEEAAAFPRLCPRGSYCPPGSAFPLVCPAGTFSPADTSNTTRSSFDEACIACPPGTYSAGTNGQECTPCTPGFVCLGSTRSATPSLEDNGYPCPAGHYCPEGSSVETACPAAMYNPLGQQVDNSSCVECPTDSYNALPGQAACRPCSTSASSPPASTTCTCIGAYRHFSPSDGMCVCQPLYEFVDDDLEVQSEADGDQDCSPVSFSRCDGSRDLLGQCTSPDCTLTSRCSSGAGTWNAALGLCECVIEEPLQTVCDAACQAAAPQLASDPITGHLILTDPVSGNVSTFAPSAIAGFQGTTVCVHSSPGVNATNATAALTPCRFHTISLTSAGFAGLYGITENVAVASAGAGRRLWSVAAPVCGGGGCVDMGALRRRRLQESVPAVERPVVCLEVGQGLLFDLPEGRTTHPVYVKDSFLNTNPAFDYGEFRRLAALAASTTAQVSVFGFTFQQAGVHVFASSANPDAQTIVAVQEEGTTCDGLEGPILPQTAEALVSVGVARKTEPVLEPDWVLLGSLLGGLSAVVVGVVGFLVYFRHRGWGASGGGVLATRTRKPKGSAKPSGDGGVAPPGGGGDGDDSEDDEDALDYRELLDRLNTHHAEVASSFAGQQEDSVKMLEGLKSEAADIRRMLAESVVNHGAATAGSGAADARTAAALRQIETEVAARALFDRKVARREAAVMDALRAVANGLRDRPSAVADDVTRELLRAADGEAMAGAGASAAGGTPAPPPAANFSKTPDDSVTLRQLRALISDAVTALGRLEAAVGEEASRRGDGVQLWRAAAGAGALERHPALASALESLEASVEPVDADQAALVAELGRFAAGATACNTSVHTAVKAYLREVATAQDSQNPAVVARVRSASAATIAAYLEQLNAAVRSVLGLAGSSLDRLTVGRDEATRVRTHVAPQVRMAREQAERAAADARMSTDGVAALIERINDLIFKAKSGQLGGIWGGGGGGDGVFSEGSRVSEYDSGGEFGDDGGDGARKLVRQLDQKHAMAALALEAKLQEAEDRQKEAEASREAARRQQVEDNLVDATEEQREAAMKEFEEEQEALADALNAERSRQREDMERRLAARRQEQLEKRLRLAEQQALQALAAQHAEEAAALAAQQAAAAEEEEAAARAEAAAQLASVGAGGDTTLSAEEHLARLHEELDADLQGAFVAHRAERARQAASLQASQAKRRATRRAARLAAREKDLAAASPGDRDAVVARHVALAEAAAAEEAAEAEAEAAAAAAMEQRALDALLAGRKARMEKYRQAVAAVGKEAEAEHAAVVAAMDAAPTPPAAARLAAEREAALAAAAPGDRDAIAARYAEQEAALAAQLRQEAAETRAAAAAALAAAQAQVAAADAESQLAALQDGFEAALLAATAAMEAKQAAGLDARLVQAEAEHEVAVARLADKHFKELAGAASPQQQARVQAAHEAERTEVLEAHARRVEAIVASGDGVDMDAVQAVVASVKSEYDANLATLKDCVEADQARQAAELKAKVAKRRAARQRALTKRHEAEAAKAPAAQRAAVSAAHAAERAQLEAVCAAEEAAVGTQTAAAAGLTAAAFTAGVTHDGAVEEEYVAGVMASAEARQDALQQCVVAGASVLQLELELVDELQVSQVAADSDNFQEDLTALVDAIAQAQDGAAEATERRRAVTSAEFEARLAAAAADVELALEAVHKDAARDSEALLGSVQGERRRQQAAVKRQLAARARRKKAKLAREQAEEVAAQRMRHAQEAATVSVSDAAVVDEDQLLQAVDTQLAMGVQPASTAVAEAEAKRELEAQLASEREALARKQAEERAALEKAAAEDAAAAAAAVQEAKLAALAAKRKEFETLVAARNVGTTEEMELLKAEYEAEADAAADAAARERARQQAKLQERRRARRERDLARRQDRERQEAEAEAVRQRKELQAAVECKAEQEALKAVVDSGALPAGDAVDSVLQRRHGRETSELLTSQYEERATALRLALEGVFDARRDEKAELVDTMTDAGAPQADVDAAVEALMATYEGRRREVEAATIGEVEARHAAQQLALRQRQLAELADAYATLAPEDVLRQADADAARKEMEELAAFQESMAEQRAARVSKVREEKAALEDRLSKENEAQLARLEQEHNAMMAAERDRAEQRLGQQRAKLEKQKEEQRQAALAAAGELDQRERDRIMEEFDMEQQEAEAAMISERARQADALRKKLEARKARQRAKLQKQQEARREVEAARIEAEAKEAEAKDAEERRVSTTVPSAAKAEENGFRDKVKRAQLRTSTIAMLATTETKDTVGSLRRLPSAATMAPRKRASMASVRRSNASRRSVVNLGVVGRPRASVAPARSTGGGGGEAAAAANAALQQRLVAIEKLVMQLAAKLSQPPPVASPRPLPPSPARRSTAVEPAPRPLFSDPANDATPCEGVLVAVPEPELGHREAMRLTFARRLLKLMGVESGPQAITVAAATSLPANTNTNNAYRNAFHWDPATRCLHIRVQRFTNVGDLSAVLLHCVAHILADPANVGDDSTPAFQAQFHKLFRAVGQELFTAQQAVAPQAAALQQARPSFAFPATPSGTRASFAFPPTPGGGFATPVRQASLRSLGAASELEEEEEEAEPLAGAHLDTGVDTGSITTRLAAFPAITKRAGLKDYIAALEAEVLADEDEEGPTREVAVEDWGAGGDVGGVGDDVEWFLGYSRQHLAFLQDSSDAADRQLVERAGALSEASDRVEALKFEVEGGKAVDMVSLRADLEAARQEVADHQAAMAVASSRHQMLKEKLDATQRDLGAFEAMPAADQVAASREKRAEVRRL